MKRYELLHGYCRICIIHVNILSLLLLVKDIVCIMVMVFCRPMIHASCCTGFSSTIICDHFLIPRSGRFCRGYVGIHSSGFRDFLLKPELLRAITDCGFEHPSEGELAAILFFQRKESAPACD
jgi:hypothetical protein